MLRLKQNALTLKSDNKYYYNDILFTGIVFAFVNQAVEKIIELEDGIETGPYRSNFFENYEELIKIDRDYLEGTELESGEEIGPYFFNNDKFNGLAFDFDDQFCTGVSLFDDGNLKTEIGWYKSGELEYFNKGYNGIYGETINWYKNGNLKKIFLIQQDGFWFNLELASDSKINILTIDDNYFSQIENAKSIFRYCLIKRKDDFKSYAASENISLSGTEIDDDIFRFIRENNGLASTHSIRFYNTSITDNEILGLANYSQLKQISIDDENDALINVTQELKNRLPDCEVIYNRKKIEVLK